MGRDPILEKYFTPKPARVAQEMSRAEQTGWIVGTLIVLFAAGVLIFVTRTDPSDAYPECWPFYTQSCKTEVAVGRLMRH